MFGLFKGPLVGVDVGGSAVKILVGTVQKNRIKVTKLATIPLPPQSRSDQGYALVDPIQMALSQAIDELSLKNPQVATSIYGSGVQIKKVTLPLMPKKEIPIQAEYEAQQVFPQQLTHILTDFLLLGEGTQPPGSAPGTPGWDLLLVGVRQDLAAQVYEVLSQVGMKVKVLDVDMFASSDFAEQCVQASKKEIIGYVDLGASSTKVCVRHSGKTVFVREFPTGGEHFTQIIADTLGLRFEDAEALKMQVNGAIPQGALDALQSVYSSWRSDFQQCEDIYMSQNNPGIVTRWFYYGGGSLTPSLMDYLANERDGEKMTLLPAQDFFVAGDKKVNAEQLQSWAIRLLSAAGLAGRKG